MCVGNIRKTNLFSEVVQLRNDICHHAIHFNDCT